MSRAAVARREEARYPTKPLPRGYLKRSEMPFASLVFLLPFIVLYELGTRHFAFDPAHQTERRIIAFNLMHQFFQWFGATGKYMPPLAVAGILLSVHIARNDPWKVMPSTLLGMALESAAWAIPLLLVGRFAARYVVYYHDWRTMVVLSLGAGIYEELVFRLVGL